jgi:hypothetical protein
LEVSDTANLETHCFAAALAQRENAQLLSGDPEFKAVDKAIKIGWLKRSQNGGGRALAPHKLALDLLAPRTMLAAMGASSYSDIKSSLRNLYLDDPRPWLAGFSGAEDSTMLASLIVEVAAVIPDGQREKPVAFLRTNGHYGIPVSRVGQPWQPT